MTMDFKKSIKGNLNTNDGDKKMKDNTTNDTEQVVSKFVIGKKREVKDKKVSFPIYMMESKKDKIDKIAKKTNYNRNELINMMIDFCIENIEFKND